MDELSGRRDSKCKGVEVWNGITCSRNLKDSNLVGERVVGT